MTFLDIAEAVSVGRRPERAGINYECVVSVVCRNFNLTQEELYSTRRNRFTTLARRTAIHLLLRLCPLVLTDVGAIMRRDHTTVIWHRDKAQAEIERNQEWRDAVEVLAQEIIKESKQ